MENHLLIQTPFMVCQNLLEKDKQVLKPKIKTTILRIFNTYGPGENLNYFKKGMVSIYCGYIWKKSL